MIVTRHITAQVTENLTVHMQNESENRYICELDFQKVYTFKNRNFTTYYVIQLSVMATIFPVKLFLKNILTNIIMIIKRKITKIPKFKENSDRLITYQIENSIYIKHILKK